MLDARAAIRGEHVERLAEQVASRVWVMRVTDLDAWKKEFEDWRSRENGRQDLKVEFVRKPYMKFEQLSVIFPLKPPSKGVGRGLADSVSAVREADDVPVPVPVPCEDEDFVDDGGGAVVIIELDDDEEEEE